MEIFYLLNISQLSQLLSGQGLEMVCSVDLGPEVCPIIHVRVQILLPGRGHALHGDCSDPLDS